MDTTLLTASHFTRTAPRGSEPDLWRLVGGTPLVSLGAPSDVQIMIKAEWLNPGGSVKDRPAREILRRGRSTGMLPARRLLDASSGNTAIAYAMLGAAARIGITVCVPANVSAERLTLLRMYGAEVIETDPLQGSDGAIQTARDLAARRPQSYWYADQYNNPANSLSHERGTGPEIWNETFGRVTHFVAGVGTSGTLMGAGRFLKHRNPRVRLIAVEPDSPFHGLEGLKHMETAIVPGLYDRHWIDETLRIGTEEAESHVRRVARRRGLFVGWSTGAALAAAERVAAALSPTERRSAIIVAVGPDGGTRYASERQRLFDG